LTAPNYSAVWHELDQEAAGTTGPALVRRLVEAGAGAELHLAVGVPGAKRYLMVRMPDDWDGDTAGFPKWRGARIGPFQGSERPSPHQFLVIEQGEDSPREVFEVLVADVADAVINRAVGEDVSTVVTGRLDRWKTFFEVSGLVGLSPEAQQGLFGELWFLREHLLPTVGTHSAVSAWDVTHRALHDFQFPGHAFEVKTSSAKQHQRVRIASERQLDTTGLDSLHLVVISISVVQGGGETLTEVVASIRDHLSKSPPTARLFEDKLLDEGYMNAHAELYRSGYAFRTVRVYKVGPGFPRVLESDLKPGVGDVSYSVVLSACEPFRSTLQEALGAIGPGRVGS
jgi:hypothetical protein